MKANKIIPIVEGYGEEKAVPCIIRRWLRHRGWDRHFVVPDLAINAKGCGTLKATYDRTRHVGIEHYVEAALRDNPEAVLVVLDADNECLIREPGNSLGPSLLARAQSVAPELPMAVVVANREYEAWFLANFQTIKARGGFSAHAQYSTCDHPESHCGCKGLMAELMGCSYEETVHQLFLTKLIGFTRGACFRSPSYGKLMRDLERLTREIRKKGAL
ncbi:MAG: hypothetical protein A4E62_00571 [Syntrophorhabdus sp. PtaU1.Bin002]|nr:MAG: hypothetical protein A4E62_00571 [Syntrophorhabdus sp. PtaU1.Bin002]